MIDSLALRDVPRPDFADVLVVSLDDDEPRDARRWAEQIFSVAAMPAGVRLAMRVRQLLAPLVGVARAEPGVFAVREGDAREALVAADEEHLAFRCAVAVHPEQGLLSVTTAVQLHGRRGRLYFLPVRGLHPVVVQALVRSARRHLRG